MTQNDFLKNEREKKNENKRGIRKTKKMLGKKLQKKKWKSKNNIRKDKEKIKI